MTQDDLTYEMICDNCGEEYTVSAYETEEIPKHCPFCGHEIDITEFDDSDEEEDFDLDDEFDIQNDRSDTWR